MQEPYRPRGSGDTGTLDVRRTLVHAGHYIRRHTQPAVWRTPSYRARGGEGRGLAEATVLAWPMRRRQPFSGVAIPWSRNGGRWMAASGLRQGRES